MRAKVVLPLLIVSGGLLALMLLKRPARNEASSDSTFIARESSGSASSKASSNSKTSLAIHHGRFSDETADASPAESPPDDYVTGRVAELLELAMTDDPASLSAILAELNNPNEDIREAAVLGAVQFKSVDAVPALMDAYNRTEEPEEKLSIRKAIDFLKTGR